MGEEKNELIFYYKARRDPYTKPPVEDGESPTGVNVDLEIILLGPKREQLRIKDKRRKRSTKLRELFSLGKSGSATDLDDDDFEDEEKDTTNIDNQSRTSNDDMTPVDGPNDNDDENYQSAEESKSDATKEKSNKNDEKKPSRIPRIKPVSSSARRTSSKISRQKDSDLLDRLESLFSSTEQPARGNSGSNVDYMDYF